MATQANALKSRKKPAKPKSADLSPQAISLALQGGGAWGAYTWGVLDYLLSRDNLLIDQISGTSAGAINGAIVCSALARGGATEARQALESFWRSVAEHPARSMLQTMMGPIGELMTRRVNNWMLGAVSVSPYQTDPLDWNPMRAAISAHVDIDAIRSRSGPQLFVTATNVRTGLPRVFGSAEITLDSLAASACLPQIFRAVQIDGEAYWDGGYCGNPTLWPLVRHGKANDIVLVQLSPERRDDVPRDAAGIRERAAEIVFNSSLVAEMQAIHAIREMASGTNAKSAFLKTRFHRIGPPSDTVLSDSGAASDRSWLWLTQLRDEGQLAARRFMTRNRSKLGVESTLDIAKAFFDHRKPLVNLQLGRITTRTAGST